MYKRLSRLLGVAVLISASLLIVIWSDSHATNKEDVAVLLTISGPIGPATADYVNRGIEDAQLDKAKLIILEMDTPGGLADSMRDIIESILKSSIPVVTYVAPSGAHAASAGTYILYASHVAAMAPGTNLGAATPVALGGAESTMEHKFTNDAVAYIRSLAELRGRNADWAEKSVKESATLSAQSALNEHVIDYVSDTIPDLLKQLQGLTIKISPKPIILSTQNLVIKSALPDWRFRFLNVITDPNIAYILLLIGMYGLILEFLHPGVLLPGVAGTISLLIALYAFHLLPINYVGLALILCGIGFLVAEAFVTSYGALGVGGVIAFIVGSVLLMDTKAPGYTIAFPLILSVGIITGGFILFIVNLALRARARPVVSGREEIIGSTGEILSCAHEVYRVRVHGEIWQAHSDAKLKVGQKIRVTEMNGLFLKIELL